MELSKKQRTCIFGTKRSENKINISLQIEFLFLDESWQSIICTQQINCWQNIFQHTKHKMYNFFTQIFETDTKDTKRRVFSQLSHHLFWMWCIHMSLIYVNYIYLTHSEMISETKYVHSCDTHFIVPTNKIVYGNVFQIWTPCVQFGYTYIISLYISERFRDGSLSLWIISALYKVEMQK